MFVALIPSRNGTTTALVISDSKIPNFSEKDLGDLVRELVVKDFFGNKTEEVRDRILEFYSRFNSEPKDNVFYLQRYTQLLSDLQFNMGVLYDILLRGYYGWKVFAYNSPYFNEKVIPQRCPVKSRSSSDPPYILIHSRILSRNGPKLCKANS